MKKLLFILMFASGLHAQTSLTTIKMCDHNNGHADFNLTLKNPEILNGLTETDYSITFHTSITDAEEAVNAIITPQEYTNIIANEQTVYARRSENNSVNYAVFKFDLSIIPKPIATFVQVEVVDNTDENPNDGLALVTYEAISEQIIEMNNEAELEIRIFHDSALTIEETYPFYVQDSNTFYYTVKNVNTGCESISVISISIVEESLDLEDTFFSQLKVYPNPVQDTLNITSTTVIDTISVVNSLGQTVIPRKGSNSVDMSNLVAGLYFVKLSSGKAVKTIKIIKL